MDKLKISIASEATQSTLEIYNIFSRNFRLICRDTESGHTYYLEDRFLKKYDDRGSNYIKSKTVESFNYETFQIFQNIFTLFAIHYEEMRLQKEEALCSKPVAKKSRLEKLLRVRNIKSNAERTYVRGDLRLAPN